MFHLHYRVDGLRLPSSGPAAYAYGPQRGNQKRGHPIQTPVIHRSRTHTDRHLSEYAAIVFERYDRAKKTERILTLLDPAFEAG